MIKNNKVFSISFTIISFILGAFLFFVGYSLATYKPNDTYIVANDTSIDKIKLKYYRKGQLVIVNYDREAVGLTPYKHYSEFQDCIDKEKQQLDRTIDYMTKEFAKRDAEKKKREKAERIHPRPWIGDK